MTSKLKFIEAACVAFNCTHSVVLSAVSGKPSVHPGTCSQIKALAEKSCAATHAEWEAFAAACSAGSVADKFLWSITTGAELIL